MKGINPKRNFLLKKAKNLAKVKDGGYRLSLYKQQDGRLLLLTKSSNPLVNDQLNLIDPQTAKQKFNIDFS